MSQISKQALIVDNSQSFPNNNAGAITPSDLRAFNVNMIDSLVNEIPYQSFTASVTNSIELLNAFTASQQPVFNSLNSFTASQLVVNSGYNAFTWSADARLDATESDISDLQAWSGSVNEIRFNGGIPQYSTRLSFGGFISASFVPNVNGLIADINVLNDPSKLNTSSFNDYTASTAATQSVFSASVATSISSSTYSFNQFSSSQSIFNNSITASVQELLDLSSSLSGGYATQGELDAVSSSLNSTINSVSASLVNTIDTKTNTSSFNAFTQSQNNLNVTFATTGSNTFIGNQIISGTFIQSGSNTFNAGPGGTAVGTWIQNRTLISGPTGIENPRLFISCSDGSVTTITRNSVGIASVNEPSYGSGFNAYSSTASFSQLTLGVYDNPNFNTDVELDIRVGSNGTVFYDWDNGTAFDYIPWMTLAPNVGDNPAPNFIRGLQSEGSTTIIGSATITGSITITGSAYGNVVSASIISNTASIDLSAANYFTLTIASDTKINVTNVQPGITTTLVINTAGATSASFSSNVKQSSGSFYVPSVSGNIDILSFTAVTPSTVYVVPAYTFV